MMTFLRFPSVSTEPERTDDMRNCARWIAGQLERARLKVELLETVGHPAVFADSGPVDGHENAPTLLCYGHYDVQPAGDLEAWNSPPFEPTVRDGNVFARGAADDKGQVMTHLAAFQCWREAVGTLPVRIKFLIEGEEEIGSPNLPDLIRREKERLACDYVLISDTAKHDASTPAIPYGTRGLVYKHIIVEGPTRDLHSGTYGGTVANPANTLARIIAGLHDENNRITIPGFYDEVIQLDDREREGIERDGLSDKALLEATGSAAAWGEKGFATALRCTVRPTLDVNGLSAGFVGPGSSTIIPAGATAKVSMRLVPDQDPEKISQAFDDAVRAVCPPSVRLRIETKATCAAYTAPLDSPGLKAAAHALEQSFGRPPVLTREGGTLPILPLFKQILGADSLMLGFALPDCNLHSPNEFFGLEDFSTGTQCILRFIGTFGQHQF